MHKFIDEHPVLTGICMVCATLIICTAFYATSVAPGCWPVVGVIVTWFMLLFVFPRSLGAL